MTNFFTSIIYNYGTFILYIGGAFSAALLATFAYIRQYNKREAAKEDLEKKAIAKGEEVDHRKIADILDNSTNWQSPDFIQDLISWGIQPLFIVSFVNLFGNAGLFEKIIAAALLVFTILHESIFVKEHSKKWQYQVLVGFLWISSYFFIAYKTNQRDSKTLSNVQTEQVKSTTANSGNSAKNVNDSLIKKP